MLYNNVTIIYKLLTWVVRISELHEFPGSSAQFRDVKTSCSFIPVWNPISKIKAILSSSGKSKISFYFELYPYSKINLKGNFKGCCIINAKFE